jgi:hypothetical protein
MFKSNYFLTPIKSEPCAKNHGISYMGQGKVELLEIEYPKLALVIESVSMVSS